MCGGFISFILDFFFFFSVDGSPDSECNTSHDRCSLFSLKFV